MTEKMTKQLHGGDRYQNQIRLDFSVNTNPLGMPENVRRQLQSLLGTTNEVYEWYPDPHCDQVRGGLAAHHRLLKEQIVCGNGASELIYALSRSVCILRKNRQGCKKGNALLPVPSFGEYERALEAAGTEIQYYMLSEQEDFQLTERILNRLNKDIDFLILCNPNNPTGSLIPEALLLQILIRCRENRIFVLLDECFLELVSGILPESGSSFLQDFPNLIILKAFTKLYALAGVRFGYCICADKELLRELKAQLPCWNVSGIAQIAAMTVLDNQQDVDYISQTKALLLKERKGLKVGLERLGMQVLPGTANFICFYDKAVETTDRDLYELLLKRGILIRDCGSYKGMKKGWYRIAVKKHDENMLLLDYLKLVAAQSEEGNP